jgi:molybdate transport system substrate-binding protein
MQQHRATARARVAAAAAVVAVLLISACGGSGGDSSNKKITVLAPSSLTEAFGELAKKFEASHNGTTVTISFAGSSALVTQVIEGAPADVIATADESSLARLTEKSLLDGTPVVFARNRLVILVAKGNPKAVTSLADLANPKLAVVVAAPQVPAGKYAAEALAKAGVKVTAKSQEENVKAVVTKVTAGEADAGIVYVTDVRAAASKAEGIPIPPEFNIVANYPIARLKSAANNPTAAAFVAYVQAPEAQTFLQAYGFSAP